MTLLTELGRSDVVARLKEEVGSEPSFLECLITLGAAYLRGSSPVCGKVCEEGFVLRSRHAPAFSNEAVGRFELLPNGTRIHVVFREPLTAKCLLLARQHIDEEVILKFLTDTLRASIASEV